MRKILFILICFILAQGFVFGQNDSIKTKKEHVSIIVISQIDTHTKYGLFYSDYNLNTKSKTFAYKLKKPMFSFSWGVQYKGLFQSIEYAYQEGAGLNDTDLKDDKVLTRLMAYHVWFDFFHKKRFPIKPFISLDLSYIVKNHQYYDDWEFGGSYSGSNNFYDYSKTFLIEAPMGIYFNQDGFFWILAYNLPISSWIKGNYDKRQYIHEVYTDNDWVFNYKDTYSGSSTSKRFEKPKKDLFSFQFGYLIKL